MNEGGPLRACPAENCRRLTRTAHGAITQRVAAHPGGAKMISDPGLGRRHHLLRRRRRAHGLAARLSILTVVHVLALHTNFQGFSPRSPCTTAHPRSSSQAPPSRLVAPRVPAVTTRQTERLLRGAVDGELVREEVAVAGGMLSARGLLGHPAPHQTEKCGIEPRESKLTHAPARASAGRPRPCCTRPPLRQTALVSG